MICIDFETRSTVNIKNGVHRYAHQADVLMLGFTLDGGATVHVWEPKDRFDHGPFGQLCSAIEGGATIHAHNAAFERAIWATCMVPLEEDIPEVDDTQWRCTAIHAAYVGLPRKLSKAGEALGLDVQKSKAGDRLIRKYSIPVNMKKLESGVDMEPVWNTPTDEDWQAFKKYCAEDVLAECALYDRLKDIGQVPVNEWALWRLDQRINTQGVRIDRPKVQAIVRACDQEKLGLNKTIDILTGGEVTSPTQVKRIKQRMPKEVESLDEESLTYWLGEGASRLTGHQRQLLELRWAYRNTSVGKYQAMLDMADGFRIVRDLFTFYGASNTGRWAGAKIQPQNLPRPDMPWDEIKLVLEWIKEGNINMVVECFGDMLKVAPNLIRPMFIPRGGKKFIVADFASIEARVLAWCAMEERALKTFREGGDIYKEMAGRIYSIKPEEVTKDQRFFGKQAVLGCGYGMGAQRFRGMCVQYGRDVEEDFAQRIIDTYRGTFSNIQSLWYELGDAFITCITRKRMVEAWPVKFFNYGQGVEMALYGQCQNNIRSLYYHGAAFEPVVRDEEGNQTGGPSCYRTQGNAFTPKRLWGGVLTENLVQALARDILANAMQRITGAGGRIVLHVHDEVVVEVPIDSDWTVEKVERLMCDIPAWAKGCPIEAEGFETGCYRK